MGRKLNPKSIYGIVFLVFFVLMVWPVLYTFLTVEGGWLKNIRLLDRKIFVLLIWSSFISLIISLLSTIIGGVLSFFVYKTRMKFRSFFKMFLLVPLLVSPYILAVAWKDMFFYLGLDMRAYGYVGMIGVLTMIYTPFSMLLIGSGLKNIDGQLEEAGLMLTGFRSMYMKIVLPLIKPALMSSLVLVFLFSISEFSVPAYFGVKVFTTEIFTQFSAFYNHGLAVMQSILLVLICVLLLLADRRYLLEVPFLSMGTKGMQPKVYSIGGALGLCVVGCWFLFSAVLPILVLFAQAFQGGIGVFGTAYNLLRHSFSDTIFLAVLGGIMISLVGLVVGLGHFRKGKVSGYFEGLLLFIFAIPSTVYGISLIKFYNHSFGHVIYSSYAIILIGYVGKFTYIASRIIGNGVLQIPPSLDESAEIMGIFYWTRLRKIIIPIILPSLFVAFVIGLILSLGELGTTIMVYPPGTEIMSIQVFTIMANAPESLTSAMVLLVLVVSILLVGGVFLMRYLMGRRKSS